MSKKYSWSAIVQRCYDDMIAEQKGIEKTLILIRGLPGSGKTTKAKQMCSKMYLRTSDLNLLPDILVDKCERADYNYYELTNEVCADDYLMVDGKYEFNRFKLGYAHQNCVKCADALMSLIDDNPFESDYDLNHEVIVHNTFTTKKEMKPYYELAEKHNWQIKEIICDGNYGSIHDVPEETMEKMKNRFEY